MYWNRNLVLTLAFVALTAGPTLAQQPLLIPPVPTVEGEAAPAAPIPPVAEMEQVIIGEPGCCAHCRQACPCQKQTRIVCEMKKVKKKTWVVECEDVCTLAPRSPWPTFKLPTVKLPQWSLWGSPATCGDAFCGDGACGEGACSSVACAAEDCQPAGPPRAAHCRTRKILVEKEYVVEVPVYKCIVEYNCPGCGSDLASNPLGGTQPIASNDEVPHVASLPRDRSGYAE